MKIVKYHEIRKSLPPFPSHLAVYSASKKRIERKCSPFIRLRISKRVLQNIEGFPRYHDFCDTPISTEIFAFNSALPIEENLPFAPLPAILHYFSSTYQLSYVSIHKPRCIDRLDLAIFDSRRRASHFNLTSVYRIDT